MNASAQGIRVEQSKKRVSILPYLNLRQSRLGLQLFGRKVGRLRVCSCMIALLHALMMGGCRHSTLRENVCPGSVSLYSIRLQRKKDGSFSPIKCSVVSQIISAVLHDGTLGKLREDRATVVLIND